MSPLVYILNVISYEMVCLNTVKFTLFASCAKLWREMRLKDEDEGRKERQRELDIMERELELKQRQLDMEKQKVTIKECFPNGGNVELTCYYDDSMQEKVRNLLKGNKSLLSVLN